MLDTKVRCWHQDFCGCQAMADQAFQGLFCQGHILLPPSQSNGIVETGWTVLQTSSSPAGSITLMGPWPLVLLEKHSIVSGQRDAIKPQQAFLFELPLGSIHPKGFASRWQATPGRGPASHRDPGKLHLATELLCPMPTAERSPPSSPVPSSGTPTPVPAPVTALSQTTWTAGAVTLCGSLQHCKEVDKEEPVFS